MSARWVSGMNSDQRQKWAGRFDGLAGITQLHEVGVGSFAHELDQFVA